MPGRRRPYWTEKEDLAGELDDEAEPQQEGDAAEPQSPDDAAAQHEGGETAPASAAVHNQE